MEEYTINERVKEEIAGWKKRMYLKNISPNISAKAIDFIIEMINNISEDPSENWGSNRNYDDIQHTALAKIPAALDYITDLQRPNIKKEFTISSWEIWQSLSLIMIKFCFIPEKDM